MKNFLSSSVPAFITGICISKCFAFHWQAGVFIIGCVLLGVFKGFEWGRQDTSHKIYVEAMKHHNLAEAFHEAAKERLTEAGKFLDRIKEHEQRNT